MFLQDEITKLLKKILLAMESFSIDDLISKPERQPLEMQEFSIWMLLVLNDFRVQIGAAIGDLATWLTQLMPKQMYDRGLRPCQSKLAHFLLTLSKFSSNMDNDEMNSMIPEEIFIVSDTPKAAIHEKMSIVKSTSSKSNSKKKVDDECDKIYEVYNKSEKLTDSSWKQEQPSAAEDGSVKAEIHWEDFLRQTSLDELMEGTAKPLSLAQFSNGVIYSLWRTSLMIGGGSETFRGWLMQIAPILLDHQQTEKIILGVKSLHDHLEKQPEDVCKLGIQVIPFLGPSMKLRVDGQVHEVSPLTEGDDSDTSEFNILGSLSTNCSRTVQNSRNNGKANVRSLLVPALDHKCCEEISNNSNYRGANHLSHDKKFVSKFTDSSSSTMRRNRLKKKKTRGGFDTKQVVDTSSFSSPEERSLLESDQSNKEVNEEVEERSEKKRNLIKSGLTSSIDSNHITSSSIESVSMRISSQVNSTKIEIPEDSGKSGSQLGSVSNSKSGTKTAKVFKDKTLQQNSTEADRVKSNSKAPHGNEKSKVHMKNSKASPYKAKVKRKLNTDDITVEIVQSDVAGTVQGGGKLLHKTELPKPLSKPMQGNKKSKLLQSKSKAHGKQSEKNEKLSSGDYKTIKNSSDVHLKHKVGELSQGNTSKNIEEESVTKNHKSNEVPETQKHVSRSRNQPSKLSKSALYSNSKVLSSSLGQHSKRLPVTPALSVEEVDTKAKKAKPTFEDLMSYDT